LDVDCFRPYRNGDSPALVALWNGGLPAVGVARPLSVHEFDALVMGKLGFDPAGLILVERDGRAVGFVHAGFGPVEPAGPSHRLDTQLGTVAILVVDPTQPDRPAIASALFARGEAYLRDRGTSVVYAGGSYPLGPFYWGLYGGSEWSGILGADRTFADAAEAAGLGPVATSILLDFDLLQPEPRDPKGAMLRRLVRLDVIEDVALPRWWDALALGFYRPTLYRLVDRTSGKAVARATTWDMAGFDRVDGRARTGLIDLEVDPAHRRRGYGRLLLGEILKHGRGQMVEVFAVQTASTNAPALALYDSLGFARVETATLYRRPGPDSSVALPGPGGAL